LSPPEAFKLLEAASEVDKRLGALMTFLLYVGPRLSEALRLTWGDIDLTRATALLRETKNGEPITVHLPPAVVAALASLDKTKRRVFGLSKCARLYALLDRAEKLSGVILPPRSAFHTLRHSHAMWRRMFSPAPIPARWSRPASGSRATPPPSMSTWTCRPNRGSPTCSRPPVV